MGKTKGTLPSGSVRVQVYDYTDKVTGKKKYQSFTAATKTEAKEMARQWKKQKSQLKSRVTVAEAVEGYIQIKSGVLSPTTIREYVGIQRRYFTSGVTRFADIDLRKLDNIMVQQFVSTISYEVSPKTVSNIYGLLSSTIKMYMPDFRLHTTLPAKEKAEMYTPSDEDVRKLLAACEGTDLEIAILLAAFGPLRRGEICALEKSDIRGNIITVNKTRVRDKDGTWLTKRTPKTYGSNRKVEMPAFVIAKIGSRSGRIIKVEPDNLTRAFKRIVDREGLPDMHFHSLRHYAASIMHAQGIPDQYIMARGGWSTPDVMRTVYQDVISIEEKRQTKKILEHFEKYSSAK